MQAGGHWPPIPSPWLAMGRNRNTNACSGTAVGRWQNQGSRNTRSYSNFPKRQRIEKDQTSQNEPFGQAIHERNARSGQTPPCGCAMVRYRAGRVILRSGRRPVVVFRTRRGAGAWPAWIAGRDRRERRRDGRCGERCNGRRAKGRSAWRVRCFRGGLHHLLCDIGLRRSRCSRNVRTVRCRSAQERLSPGINRCGIPDGPVRAAPTSQTDRLTACFALRRLVSADWFCCLRGLKCVFPQRPSLQL